MWIWLVWPGRAVNPQCLAMPLGVSSLKPAGAGKPCRRVRLYSVARCSIAPVTVATPHVLHGVPRQ